MSCRLATRGHLFAQIHGWTGEHNSLPVAGSNAAALHTIFAINRIMP